MKKIILFVLTASLFGCYYGEPVYPTINGTYILRSVMVNEVDVIDSEIHDTIYGHTFIFPDPIGPLDTMIVNKTRINIDGNRLRIGYYVENGGDEWEHEYPISIKPDLITGQWKYLDVTYITETMTTKRHYLIGEDGLEYLYLDCPSQYEETAFGNSYECRLEFYRTGP